MVLTTYSAHWMMAVGGAGGLQHLDSRPQTIWLTARHAAQQGKWGGMTDRQAASRLTNSGGQRFLVFWLLAASGERGRVRAPPPELAGDEAKVDSRCDFFSLGRHVRRGAAVT